VLNRAFDMKNLGEIKVIIGIRVIRDRFKGTLILDQTSYVYQILMKKGIKNYSPSDILMRAKLYIEFTVAENILNADIRVY